MQIVINDQHDYGYEVPPCSRKDLINLATAVQRTVGYKGDGPFPVMKLVEHVFCLVYDNFVLDVVPERDLEDKFGETFPDRHLIRIREDIYDAAVANEPFARMTVAHECGHLIKHEGIPVAMARRATSDLPAYRSSEWQANAFAGALLIPACKIVHMTESEIASRFLVTPTAASVQLKAIRKEARKWPLPTL